MQNITKAQVLALFLGTASAQAPYTISQVINGPQTMSPSGTTCNGNADCATAGEKCGAFQREGDTPQNICVAEANQCGAAGRLGGKAFSIQCWADPAEGATAVAPAAVDPAAIVTALDGLITKPVTHDWNDNTQESKPALPDLLISPRFRYQDGWWIPNAQGVWTEIDKPIDNRCYLNSQCPTKDGIERCCAVYPDTNNRRCMARSLDKTSVTIGPITFVPECAVEAPTTTDTSGSSEEPEIAIDDISSTALAEASEELTKFVDGITAEYKKANNYDSLTGAEKTAFDEGLAAQDAKDKAFMDGLRKTAKYNEPECKDECKALFEADLLVWLKQVYETCKEDQKGISCRKNEEIKEAEELAKANADKHYYSGMNVEERAAFDKARLQETEKLEASLAAAWVKDQQPAEGLEGSSCAATGVDENGAALTGGDSSKCTNQAHCCGNSRRQDGANVNAPLNNICVSKTNLSYTDGLGRKYNHTCMEMATKVAATAAAAIVAAYSLM